MAALSTVRPMPFEANDLPLPPALEHGGSFRGVKILIVDDEPRNLDVLESVLESSDYRLVRAATPDEALLALIDGEFAAIVLDIQMPGMSGIELAHLIKQRKRTQDIPIIFLTAYFQEEKFVLEGYNVGAVDYLTKPVNPQILRSKVAVFVELFRKTRALAEVNQTLEREVDQRRHAEDALRFANNELEARVMNRTADLTRANDELRASGRALRESEERFRLLADTSPVLIWVDGPNGCEFVNRAYADFFGRPREELLGFGWAEAVAPEDASGYIDGYRAAAAAQQPFAAEARFRRHDGKWRWLLSRMVPRFTPGGGFLGYVGSSTDVTDLKRIGEDLQRARDEALAASRAKDDFLAALSHELRTPLNPVLLLASDAAEDTTLPESVRADFEVIRKNVELEANLIDDLLDLTRITRGKLAVQLRAIDVHHVLREALAAVRAEVEQKRIVLNFELAAERTVVLGDAVRLQQVFWNVLRNAAKFTPEVGRIIVSTRVVADHIAITIADTGMGMTQRELDRIFVAFSQGDHAVEGISRRFGGLGLGLAISHMLIERHGGRIRATSPGRGHGATIVIELPLSTAIASESAIDGIPPAATPARVTGAETSSSANGAVRGSRILLVEDHAPTRTTLTHLLSRRHYDVAAASTLADALALIQAEEFDLLVSDIGLPDGDGCLLMMELRARHPKLPGIALSGFGMEADIARSRSAGFAHHFTKPVDVQALDRVIVELLLPPPPTS